MSYFNVPDDEYDEYEVPLWVAFIVIFISGISAGAMIMRLIYDIP